MYISRQIKLPVIMYFSRNYLVWYILLSSAVYYCYEFLGYKFLDIPFLPIATIGTAVAFYVGFKNNSSYERLWEARKIWGSITNVSRSWAISVINLVARNSSSEKTEQLRKELVDRHVCWVHALRIQLRRSHTCSCDLKMVLPHTRLVYRDQPPQCYDTEMKDALAKYLSSEEASELEGIDNKASKLLSNQLKQLSSAKDERLLDEFEHSNMQQLIYQCFDLQGGAERIKTFPFPRQYAHFSMVFVSIFTHLLPFGLIGLLDRANHELTWLTIPFSVLISWIFLTMELVGDSSEDPFIMGINDVPITAISINIERDLKELLGEAELPASAEPVNNILL